MKKLSLVRYNYDSLPKDFKKETSNPFEYFVFCYLGDIPNMGGHSYVQDIKTGKGYIFHTENLVEINKDEL